MIEINDENYYSEDLNWQYMSVSQFKQFSKCEAKALAELHGVYKGDNKEAFLVGNFVHSAFESETAHEEFLTTHQEDMLTKQGKLRAPFVLAEKMVDRIKQDNFFASLYQGEKEVIITGILFGVCWKGKVDCLNIEHGYFVDLKTTKEIEKKLWSTKDNNWVSFVEEYGYILQLGIYKKLLEKQYKKTFTPYIYAVSKQMPPNIEAIEIPEEMFGREFKYVEDNITRFVKIKDGEVAPKMCGVCEYCRQNKEITKFKSVMDLIERRR